MAIIDILDELEEAEGGIVASPQVAGVCAPSSAALQPSASAVGQLLKEPINNLEDVAKLFKAAKSAAEIFVYAQDCSTPVWLDWMIKLSPKQMKLSGQIDMRAAFVNLGPPKKAIA